MTNTITFRTAAQAAIFKCEMLGQFSDGAWENSGGDAWRDWCNVSVEVGPVVGRDFYARKDNYNLTRPDLLEVVRERMRVIAKLALLGFSHAEIKLIESGLYDLDGTWRGLPTYTGDYWDNIRAELSAYDIEGIRMSVRDKEYTDKMMIKDLVEMKKAMKVYVS